MSNRDTENLFQLIRLGQIENFCNNLTDTDLGSINEDGQNLLHEAVAYKQLQIATFLIHSGIAVNHKDKNGQTPLHYATTLNQLEMSRLILKHGGDVSLPDKHGNTPLWCAVFNARGRYEIVELLLLAGGIPTHKNKHGRSPLDFARQIADEKLTAMLSGANSGA